MHRRKAWAFFLLIAVTACILWLCNVYTNNHMLSTQGYADGYRTGYERGQWDKTANLSFNIPALDESLFPAHAPKSNETGYNLYRSHFFNSYGGGYSDGYDGNPFCQP